MTNEERDALRAMANAATPGPWRHMQSFQSAPLVRTIHGTVPAHRVDYVVGAGRKIVIPMEGRENTASSDDMAYIAATHPKAVLALLDRLATTETLLAQCKTTLEAMHPAAGLPDSDVANLYNAMMDALDNAGLDPNGDAP